MKGSSKLKVDNLTKNSIKKKSIQNLLQVKRVGHYEGKKHPKVSIISDWPSSNSEKQSKSFLTSPKLPTDLV